MELKNNYYSYQINSRYTPFEGNNLYNDMSKQNRNFISADSSSRENENKYNKIIKEIRNEIKEMTDNLRSFKNNTDNYIKNKRNNLKKDRNYSLDVMRASPHQDGLLGDTIRVLNGYKYNFNSHPYEYNTLSNYYKSKNLYNDRYGNIYNENDRTYKELNNIFKSNKGKDNTITRYLTKNNYNSIDISNKPNKAFNFNISQNINRPITNISYNFTKSSDGSNINNILKNYNQKAYSVKKYKGQNPNRLANEEQYLMNEKDQLKNKVIITNNQNKYYQSQLQSKDAFIQKLKEEINSLINRNDKSIPLDNEKEQIMNKNFKLIEENENLRLRLKNLVENDKRNMKNKIKNNILNITKNGGQNKTLEYWKNQYSKMNIINNKLKNEVDTLIKGKKISNEASLKEIKQLTDEKNKIMKEKEELENKLKTNINANDENEENKIFNDKIILLNKEIEQKNNDIEQLNKLNKEKENKINELIKNNAENEEENKKLKDNINNIKKENEKLK